MQLQTLANDIEELSVQYTERYGINRTDDWVVLKLSEEVGEFIQSYLQFSKQTRKSLPDGVALKALEDELADVIGMTLVAAKRFNLDVEAGIERKWLSHREENQRALNR